MTGDVTLYMNSFDEAGQDLAGTSGRSRGRTGIGKGFVIFLFLVATGAAGYRYGLPFLQEQMKGGTAPSANLTRVERGDLEVVVLEGGNVKALQSLALKSQVQAKDPKLLFVVEEGYEVTPEDVEAEKVLIRIDPTETEEKIEAHEIEYENAQTGLTDMDEARAIQMTESQNEISQARQKARFALLDFKKYLGEEMARKVLDARKLPSDEEAMLKYEEDFQVRLISGNQSQESLAESEPETTSHEAILNRETAERIDFSVFIEERLLGDGEAQQELRKRQDELLVAQSEHAVHLETIEASERLQQQEFITKSSLEKERVELKKAMIKELSASTSLELYRRYEFPKKAEELLTSYEDALRSIDIEKKEALAKIAQAEAKFRNAEQLFKLAEKRRAELEEQLENCTIKATRPGLVVYGSGERDRRYGNDEKIEEGATIRYKQTIITIPDMTRMGVKVSVQESHIKKIKVGQKARLIADAEPEKTLSGEVKKVAVLPDSTRWFANPNQKVYPTEIHIDGTQDWLKPGMSAQVEIVVNQLEDVLHVPLQCVSSDAGETVVWVSEGGRPRRQPVVIGDFNDNFIEVREGLDENDMVYLARPDGVPETIPESDEDIAASSPPTG